MALIPVLHFTCPAAQLFDWPYRWVGLLPIFLGGWITLWADQLFKKYQTTVKPFEKSSRLIVEGPFKISRHPMYTGISAVLFGIATLLGSLTCYLPALVFTILMAVMFIPHEEKMMLEIFGDEYGMYHRNVRRWI